MKIVNFILAIAILVLGGAVAFYFSTAAKPVAASEHGEEVKEEMERGSHNGRMLRGEALDLEITIFESGVPPEYRVYPTRNGDEIPLEQVSLTILLHRFGGRTDTIEFKPQEDFLRGQQVVEEPHSFDVDAKASYQGKEQTWSFESYEARTQISAEAAQEAGVETMPAAPTKVTATLKLPGTIGLNRDRVAHIVPRLSGVARAVNISLGSEVKKGNVLAVIDSQELADAKSAYLSALERRELAQTRFNMEKELFGKKVSREQDFVEARQGLAEAEINVRSARQKLQALGLSDEALAAIQGEQGNSLTQFDLLSPIDGTIIEKHLTLGEVASEGVDSFVLADLSVVWAEIVIYAADLKRVRVGQEVLVHSADLEQSSVGSISYIGDLVGETTRSARAIVEIPNPDKNWKPGLYVTAEVAEGVIELALAVPESALQTVRGWDVVFLTDGETYQAQPLELGRQIGGWVEVLSGLNPGDTFVSANSYLIKADIEKSGASHDH